MESYRILYRIRIEHDYFDGKPCPALQCRLTPQGKALAHRRGLLFRQTASGEWTLLFRQEPDTKKDELLLDLFIADPKFTLYTAWEGFQPSATYSLELPGKKEIIEAATAIQPTEKKRTIGSGFCTLHLRLTDELVKAAENGQPIQEILHFKESALQWEYLFIPNGEQSVPPGQLKLEDAAGKVQFTAFKECKVYGRKAWLTRSESCIPMRETYPCKLRLTAQNGDRQKRVLLSQVKPPAPGCYMDAQQGILRQVCYY